MKSKATLNLMTVISKRVGGTMTLLTNTDRLEKLSTFPINVNNSLKVSNICLLFFRMDFYFKTNQFLRNNLTLIQACLLHMMN